MFNNILLTAIVCLFVWQNVDGAMKKSWKSAANFDTDIPKFTPFEHGDVLLNNAETDLNEIKLKTTATPSSPRPTAETLVNKISSKFRAPSKYVADIYKQFHEEREKNVNDFGSFNKNSEEATTLKTQEEQKHEEIDLDTILGQLVDEADTVSDLSSDNNNSVEVEDNLDISPIVNDQTNMTKYKVGPLMNVTIDAEDSFVNVNLDQNTLKEIFTGSSYRS